MRRLRVPLFKYTSVFKTSLQISHITFTWVNLTPWLSLTLSKRFCFTMPGLITTYFFPFFSTVFFSSTGLYDVSFLSICLYDRGFNHRFLCFYDADINNFGVIWQKLIRPKINTAISTFPDYDNYDEFQRDCRDENWSKIKTRIGHKLWRVWQGNYDENFRKTPTIS